MNFTRREATRTTPFRFSAREIVELANYNRNNNNNKIETGRDVSGEILIDDLGDGIFVDELFVRAFDSAESSIGVECQTSPNFDDSHEDIDEHYLPNDPIIISSNEDYIMAIKGSPTPLPRKITELFDLSKKSYFDACVKHVGHKFITNQAITHLPNAYHSQEKSTMSPYTRLLSKLSLEISSKQRQILATLLYHAFHSASEPNSNLFIPSCANNIRIRLLDGKHSVKANLHIPEIVELDHGFVYIP
jgi:hypothetical protein